MSLSETYTLCKGKKKILCTFPILSILLLSGALILFFVCLHLSVCMSLFYLCLYLCLSSQRTSAMHSTPFTTAALSMIVTFNLQRFLGNFIIIAVIRDNAFIFPLECGMALYFSDICCYWKRFFLPVYVMKSWSRIHESHTHFNRLVSVLRPQWGRYTQQSLEYAVNQCFSFGCKYSSALRSCLHICGIKMYLGNADGTLHALPDFFFLLLLLLFGGGLICICSMIKCLSYGLITSCSAVLCSQHVLTIRRSFRIPPTDKTVFAHRLFSTNDKQ